MAEERLDTTNKIVIPGDGNLSSEETKEDIVKGLKDLTPEDMGMAAKELEVEMEKRETREREEEERRKREEEERREWEEKERREKERIKFEKLS